MLNEKVLGEKRAVVKWFSDKRGYGFLTNEGEDIGDIFVHYSSVKQEGFRTLTKGQRVSYVLLETDRGLQAADVVKL